MDINPALLATTAQPGFDISQLEDLLGPDAWRLTPATLASYVSNGDWIAARHLMYLSVQIAYELSKGNARLIISMPPRHGKSELTSVWTPVWCLDQWPEKDILTISYGADLAEEFGQKVRDIILEDADPEEGKQLLKVKIRKDSARVNRFKTTAGGGMRSVGLGGAVYGRGADILLLDDYYKNIEEATSQAKREAVFKWFATIAMSRVQKNGSAVIIATRWGVEDLSAKMLNLTGTKWKEISLPAFALGTPEFPAPPGYLGDPLGRQPGEPLWPEFYNEDRLRELLSTMGTFLFSGIYQQMPKLVSSDHFKREWVKVVDDLPPAQRRRTLRSWDLAGTPEEESDDPDYTVGVKLILDVETNDIYIADMVRGRWSSGTVEKNVLDTADNDGKDVEIYIEQEPGSSGKAVAEGYIAKLKGFAARYAPNTGNKFVRAQPWFAAAEFGRIYMLKAPWNEEFLDECVSFPNADHDDQVDAVSQGYNYFFKKKSKAGAFGRTGTEETKTIRGDQKASGQVVTGVSWGRR